MLLRISFKRVKLSALNAVITLYHKFGWRFIKKCGSTEDPAITAAVSALWAVWGPAQRRLSGDTQKAAAETEEFWDQQSATPGSAWMNLKIILEQHGFSETTSERWGDIIHTVVRTGTGHDYSVGTDLREGQYQDQLEDAGASSTGDLAHIDTEEHGYSMLWCVPKTAGGPDGGGVGGGRRRRTHRRRRKRRKTKRRRHRRRRRRRRRRTRRRRR